MRVVVRPLEAPAEEAWLAWHVRDDLTDRLLRSPGLDPVPLPRDGAWGVEWERDLFGEDPEGAHRRAGEIDVDVVVAGDVVRRGDGLCVRLRAGPPGEQPESWAEEQCYAGAAALVSAGPVLSARVAERLGGEPADPPAPTPAPDEARQRAEVWQVARTGDVPPKRAVEALSEMDWAVAHADLGWIEQARGRAKAAALHFERAVSQDPRSVRALAGLGLARLGLRDDAGAVEAFDRMAALNPTFTGLGGRYVRALLGMAREADDPDPIFDRAVAVALRLAPDELGGVYEDRARAAEKRGDEADRLRWLQLALQANEGRRRPSAWAQQKLLDRLHPAPNGPIAPPWLPAGAASWDAAELRRRLRSEPALVERTDAAGFTLVHLAAEAGDAERVEVLIEAGARVDRADVLGQTPLHRASWGGHRAAFEALLEAGAAPDPRDRHGYSPLHRAAWAGDAAVMERLLDDGASVAARTELLETPLIVAALADQGDMVARLLARGAPTRARDHRGWAALDASAARGRLAAIEALLSANPKPSEVAYAARIAMEQDQPDALRRLARALPDPRRARLLRRAAGQGEAWAVTILLEAGADPRLADERGRVALRIAAGNGHVDVVRLLAPFGDAPLDERGQRPLDRAVLDATAAGRRDVVQALIDLGASADARDAGGGTALHVAVSRGRLSMIPPLLGWQVSAAAYDDQGWTVAHAAVGAGPYGIRDRRDREDAVRALAAAGVDLDLLSQGGTSALWTAMTNKRLSLVRLLRELGARGDVFTAAAFGDLSHLHTFFERDPERRNAIDGLGRTPLVWAVDRRKDLVVKWLLSQDASPNVKGPAAASALQVAARRQREDVVRWLLHHGADPNLTDGFGDTALHEAARRRHGAILWRLVEAGGDGDRTNVIGETPRGIWPAWFEAPHREPPPPDDTPLAGLGGFDSGIGGIGSFGKGGSGRGRSGGGAPPSRGTVHVPRLVEADLLPVAPTPRRDRKVGRIDADAGLVEDLYAAGRYAEAERLLSDLERLFARSAHPDDERYATVRHNRGRVISITGRLAEGRTLIGEALRTLDGVRPTTIAQENLAWIDIAEGQLARARETYLEVRAQRERRLGRRHPLTAVTIGRLGAVEVRLGRYREAEERLKAAIERAPGGEIRTSLETNLGALLARVGDLPAAARQLTGALRRLPDDVEDPALKPTLQANLASVLLAAGRAEGAVRLYVQALSALEQALGEHHEVRLDLLLGLAAAHRRAGAPDEAAAAVTRAASALDREPLGARHALLETERAALALARGAPDEALERALEAMALAEASGEPEVRWQARVVLAEALEASGRPVAAIVALKEAVAGLQALRGATSEALQGAFLEDKAPVYRRLARLLIDAGRLGEAEAVIGLLKREELHAFVRRDGEPARQNVGFLPAEEGLRDRFLAVRERLVAVGREYRQLREALRAGTISAAERERMRELREDLRAGRAGFAAAIDGIESRRSATRAAGATALGGGAPAGEDLRSIQALQGVLADLGDGVVAIHTLIGEEQLHLLVTTPEVQIARSAPIGRVALSRLVATFRRALKSPDLPADEPAHALYGYLVGPIAEALQQAGARTLLVSLDGVLRYVPLAALHDGDRWLAERYAVVQLTEAARDKLTRAPEMALRVAALGVTQAFPGFVALPAVAGELDGIVRREAGDDGVADGVMHLDGAFSRDAFLDVLDLGFPVVHVASHFEFRPGTFRDSFLLLGDGTQLSLEELRYGYSFRDVDLLTLSACNTAMGGEDADGRELEGMGALAQNLGARSVVATLWPVADGSTGRFMRRFYEERAKPDRTKAEALRLAQARFIATGEDPTSPEDLSHPYFWAPFVLMGNWL